MSTNGVGVKVSTFLPSCLVSVYLSSSEERKKSCLSPYHLSPLPSPSSYLLFRHLHRSPFSHMTANEGHSTPCLARHRLCADQKYTALSCTMSSLRNPSCTAEKLRYKQALAWLVPLDPVHFLQAKPGKSLKRLMKPGSLDSWGLSQV